MPILIEKHKIRITNDLYSDLVARLSDERKRIGWSRYWLALQAGVTLPTITNFENNETRASFETVLAIAQALEVKLIFEINASTKR